ncbi:MAG TPA: hypothetical protein VIK28_11550, partial [Sedimentisphaerales bacterium]
MNEKEKIALVPRPPGTLEKAGTGTKRILSCMVGDTLALAKKDDLAPKTAKFRIGEYEWCEPDYLQIMAWAEQLGLSSLEVLRRLQEGLRDKGNETRIENGKLTKLNWDAGLLPVSDFRISFPLELTELSFSPIAIIAEEGDLEGVEGLTAEGELPDGYDLSASVLKIFTVALPKLKRLACAAAGLESLSMGPAPALERFDCGATNGTNLSALDLRSFPKLKEFVCTNNRFECLDLGHVPELLELDCGMNLIKKLDLRSVPKLRKLNCNDNDMQELILPSLPELVELNCENSAYEDSGLE